MSLIGLDWFCIHGRSDIRAILGGILQSGLNCPTVLLCMLIAELSPSLSWSWDIAMSADWLQTLLCNAMQCNAVYSREATKTQLRRWTFNSFLTFLGFPLQCALQCSEGPPLQQLWYEAPLESCRSRQVTFYLSKQTHILRGPRSFIFEPLSLIEN